MAAVDGSCAVWVAVVKNFNFVPNEIKSPKNHVFLFFFHIRGLGVSDSNMDNCMFFNLLL